MLKQWHVRTSYTCWQVDMSGRATLIDKLTCPDELHLLTNWHVRTSSTCWQIAMTGRATLVDKFPCPDELHLLANWHVRTSCTCWQIAMSGRATLVDKLRCPDELHLLTNWHPQASYTYTENDTSRRATLDVINQPRWSIPAYLTARVLAILWLGSFTTFFHATMERNENRKSVWKDVSAEIVSWNQLLPWFYYHSASCRFT